jgi:molybdopterin biosynthesis enzyme
VAAGDAVGLISAGLASPSALPEKSVAITDGWAVVASDCVGASSYSPVLLSKPPAWIENGQPLPEGSDSIIDRDCLEGSSALPQIVCEARPGQGVRRTGDDLDSGLSILHSGQRIGELGVLVAGKLGLQTLSVRQPRLQLIDVPASDDDTSTTAYVERLAATAGALVTRTRATGRSAGSISKILHSADVNLIVTVGGTGEGRSDTVADALKSAGALLTHGIALAPGRTAALGKIVDVPVICLPGALEDALAVWWMIGLPVLDKLTDRKRPTEALPLVRKIASAPGIADIVLLARDNENWLPLSVGTLPLKSLLRADAWTYIAANSEGFASGAMCPAYLFENGA